MANSGKFNGQSTPAAVAGALVNWKRGSIVGKKVAIVGDSTSDDLQNIAGVFSGYKQRHVDQPGSLMYGTVYSFFAANGSTTQVFLDNGVAGKGINDVIAYAPDLIFYSFGINDVRLGAMTKDQFKAVTTTAITRLRSALPNCDIILRMPNSLLSADVGGFGFVQPNSAAQAYSNLLRDAYRELANKWSNTVLYDAQAMLFGEQSLAASPLMTNQLHPSPQGYTGVWDDFASIAGVSQGYDAGRAELAEAIDYATAYLTYPLVVQGPDYELITEGAWVGQGAGYMDFSGNQGQIARISPGDIVLQNGTHAFALPGTAGAIASGANIRILFGTGALPDFAQVGGKVGIYRNKYAGNPVAKQYLNDSAYSVHQTCVIQAAGSGYCVVGALQGEPTLLAWNLQDGDVFIHPELGAIDMSGGGQAISGDNLVLQKGGTDFTNVGRLGFLVGKGALRKSTQTTESVFFNLQGNIANGAKASKMISRGGRFATLFGRLGTAGSSTTVVELRLGGVAFATLTFGAGADFAGAVWSGAAYVNAVRYGLFEAVVTTAGAGAASFTAFLDV